MTDALAHMDDQTREDFDWQLQFLPDIKRIVGPHLLRQAPMHLDTQEATDLLVFNVDDMRIAARIRRPGYSNFWHEFTIRSKRDTGTETEWPKIRDGFGDWMFYGHEHEAGKVLPWMLIDLDVLRFMHGTFGDGLFSEMDKANGDGTYFHTVDVNKWYGREGFHSLLIDHSEGPRMFYHIVNGAKRLGT